MKKELEKIFQTIEHYGMILPGMRILAGVSGGADSVCLLYALKEYRRRVPFSLKAVHVEHGIRGEESLEDARWVEALCREWEIPCRVVRRSVEQLAKEEKLSLEEAGRKARYDAFEEERLAWQADRTAVAHNRNDQAETVLFRLARGSGLTGLCGIRPVQGKIIRPLLFLSREEIEGILTERKIGWRTDRTNQETAYTRNRIRLEILPALEEQVNERACEHIASAAFRFQEIWEYLRAQAQKAEQDCVLRKKGKGGEEVLLRLDAFSLQPALIQKELLRRCLEMGTAGLKDVGSVHMEGLRKLAASPCGKQMTLPGGRLALREKEFLRFTNGMEREETADGVWNGELSLAQAGEWRIGGKRIRVEYRNGEEIDRTEILKEKKYTKWLACDTIVPNLCLRTRRTGDYFVVNEAGGRKKLKDYLIDQKVPREERDRIWLVTQGSHVLWMVGYRISEAAKVKENTYRVMKIQIEEVPT